MSALLENLRAALGYEAIGEIELMDYSADLTPELLRPMLAVSWEKGKHAIKYPCDVQPKLDGIRAMTDGKRFWSREGNLFPEITTEHLRLHPLIIERLSGRTVDGELYVEDSEYFEDTVSALKNGCPNEEQLKLTRRLKFFAFDIINPARPELRWEVRDLALRDLLRGSFNPSWSLVKTQEAWSDEELQEIAADFVAAGLEGAIVRNHLGVYRPGERSNDLVKIKPMMDAEFPLVRMIEGKGSWAGTPIYVCAMPDGREFHATPDGPMAKRRTIWELYTRVPESFVGRPVTCVYQNLTKAGIPRGPIIAKAIRDYE